MKILICGSRNFPFECYELVEETILSHIPKDDPVTIIEGGAFGADALGKRFASEHGLALESYPANWKLYGQKAGLIRNSQMLISGCPDLVLAFTIAYPASPGTQDMINRAVKANVKTIHYNLSLQSTQVLSQLDR